MDPKTLAAGCLADHAKTHGFAASAEATAIVEGKLSDLIATLQKLGLNFGSIISFVMMILPMITSGKFDWERLLAWLATLTPVTPPTPGPMGT